MLAGWRWREEQSRKRDAWMLANLIQPHIKKRLRASHFLAKPEVSPSDIWQRIVDRKVKAGEWH